MRGQTLVELLVALSIAAVLAGLAAAGWRVWLAEQRVAAAGSLLLSDLVDARARAMQEGSPVWVCPTADQSACASLKNWSTGWMTRVEDAPAGPVVWKTELSAGDLRIDVNSSGLAAGVVFSGRGTAQQQGGGFGSGSWVVCASGARSRTITLAPSGRLRTSVGSPCA